MQRILRTLVLAVVCTLAIAATSARAAEAKHYRFVGEHPVAGGGFCHIRAPHVHIYAPVKADVLYRQHDGWNYFVGDPVAYGYEGPKYAYQGAHPIHVDVALGEAEVDGDEIEYCYLRGPHYHIIAPPPETHFEMRGDIYWYTGDFPPEFEAEKPRLAKINVVYQPLEYARPVVLLGPPPEWHDVLVDVSVGVPQPAVVVEAPEAHGVVGVGVGVRAGVEVHVPAPVFEMRVGLGTAPVVVEDRRYIREVRVKEKHGNGRGHWKGKGHW